MTDGFHPKVLLDLIEEIERIICRFRGGGETKWYTQQACTTMFFLIPENVTSERPIALTPTLIRWWEALRAPDVAKWQQKCRECLGRHGWSTWRKPSKRCGKC